MYQFKYVSPNNISAIIDAESTPKTTGFVLTAAGYILGHSHKGRQFLPSAHGKFANILFLPITIQLCLGVYLKLHIHEKTLRPWAVRFHGIIGKAYPILAWVQILFGFIAFRSYCRGDGLGQCLAHYIMVCICTWWHAWFLILFFYI